MVVRNVSLENNHRQGMVSTATVGPSHLATRSSDADRCCQQSVISAVGLLVEDTVFRDTNGTAPEAGVE